MACQGFLWLEGGVCSGFPRAGFRRRKFPKDAGTMPQFQIEGEAEIFEAAESIDMNGNLSRYSFVTAEKVEGNVVVLSYVDLKDLPDFEGLLFQLDGNEEEDAVILRQVQMFF